MAVVELEPPAENPVVGNREVEVVEDEELVEEDVEVEEPETVVEPGEVVAPADVVGPAEVVEPGADVELPGRSRRAEERAWGAEIGYAGVAPASEVASAAAPTATAASAASFVCRRPERRCFNARSTSAVCDLEFLKLVRRCPFAELWPGRRRSPKT